MPQDTTTWFCSICCQEIQQGQCGDQHLLLSHIPWFACQEPKKKNENRAVYFGQKGIRSGTHDTLPPNMRPFMAPCFPDIGQWHNGWCTSYVSNLSLAKKQNDIEHVKDLEARLMDGDDDKALRFSKHGQEFQQLHGRCGIQTWNTRSSLLSTSNPLSSYGKQWMLLLLWNFAFSACRLKVCSPAMALLRICKVKWCSISQIVHVLSIKFHINFLQIVITLSPWDRSLQDSCIVGWPTYQR